MASKAARQAADAAALRLSGLLFDEVLRAWTGRRQAQLSAEELLAAVRAIEAARGFKTTDALIAEGAAAAGAGEAGDVGEDEPG